MKDYLETEGETEEEAVQYGSTVYGKASEPSRAVKRMAKRKIPNEKWIDISSERYRVYKFGADQLRIDCPLSLYVTGRVHLIISKGQKVTMVQPGWNGIEYKLNLNSTHEDSRH